jgi:hypothetical protein
LTSSDDEKLLSDLKKALAEHEPTRAEVEARIADNDARLMALAQRGVQLDRASILQVRIGVMVEELFGDFDDPRRRALEWKLGERYAELISQAEIQAGAEIAKSKLLQGVDLPSMRRTQNGGLSAASG